MALLFADGCDLYGADADLLAAGWDIDTLSLVSAQSSSGRFGGGGIECEWNIGINRPVTISGSTIIVAFAFKVESLTRATNERLIEFKNNTGADSCGKVEVSIDGSVRVKDAAGVVQGTSASGLIKSLVWAYAEIKLVVGDAGSITVKINGTQAIDATAIDTKPGSATDVDFIRLTGASDTTGKGVIFDDILIIDDAGSFVNDFIGDTTIETKLPNGDDGTDADWSSQPSQTPGNVYTNIDDTIPGSDDGDSSYIYSNTGSDDSMFVFQNLDGTPATIHAVQVALSARKTDGGSRVIAPLLTGDVKTVGTSINPGTDYELFREIWEQSTEAVPGNWTPTLVNAARAGVRMVS
jgi:hypothetical protein